MNSFEEGILNGANTAFINSSVVSNLALRPRFISNDYKEGKKVLTSIVEELNSCKEFMISVAFVTMGGIIPLLPIFEKLEKGGIKGKIITTNYLTFSEPKALEKLASYKNIEVKMYDSNSNISAFHTKGYIFRNSVNNYRVIVGSSNMTASALTKNHEWNLKFSAAEEGEVVKDILSEFEYLWGASKPIDELIEIYSSIYEEQKRIAKIEKVTSLEAYNLKPNKMQIEFIKSMRELHRNNKSKALLISATGTGKTYASAFALRDNNPDKVLFVVHREQIAKQAKESYERVFSKNKTMGLISGNSSYSGEQFVFSTMQMMSKPEIHNMFKKDQFDYIVIDEVHRAGAESYNRIMEYFEPKFWLGMTASPERPDGFDIYKLFDNNIAYEIRLQQALEEDLLCPFHYFGITDLEIEGNVISNDENLKRFNEILASQERINYIIEKIKYYGFSGERVKGLVFCSRKEEAHKLSEAFNSSGYRTIALTGEDNQLKRENYIQKLTCDESSDCLDYIFTVDIFNEGIDIPEINQVIMLRPTESPIIFIQQLGRGLRKSEDKEYVVILDFIGNYANNFMIPIALSGDRTYNKDTVRRFLMEGTKVLPGCSSINFDEISRKRIYESINKMSTPLQLFKQRYVALKNKLGKIPDILDFYEHSEIDPILILEHKGTETYTKFLSYVEDEFKGKKILSDQEEVFLEMISGNFANGKRIEELIIIKTLLQKEVFSKSDIVKFIENEYGILNCEKSVDSAIIMLKGEFFNTKAEKEKYSKISFFDLEHIKPDNNFRRTMMFYNKLNNEEFVKQINDVIELGIRKYKASYSNRIEDESLVLYQKYSRKDVCRLLNWARDDSSTIYGYRIKYNTCPIFVTYKKHEETSKSTMYDDRFIDEQTFSWMTRNRVTLDSSESQQLIEYKKTGLKIHLFVKKSDSEGSDFYYMGQVSPTNWEQTTINNDKGNKLPIMNFVFKMHNIVREDIYDYLTN